MTKTESLFQLVQCCIYVGWWTRGSPATCREVGWIGQCWTLGSFPSCLFSAVLGIPTLCCSVNTYMPSFLLTSAGQLLPYAGVAGGYSPLHGQVVPVPMSPRAYKQPCLLQLFLLKTAYFLKCLDSSVGIWLFGSFLVWQLGVYSPSSFLGSFTVIVYMCWMFLSSPQDGNMLALGRRYVLQLLFQLILHLVTVHQTLQQCELCLSLLLILGYLTLENFRLNLPGPFPVMNILCISWEVAFQLLKTVRRKPVVGAPITRYDLFHFLPPKLVSL